MRNSLLYTCSLFIMTILLSSCDQGRVFEENRTIENDAWNFENKPSFDVYLTDTVKAYDIYVNVRITTDYKYNNIFLWVYSTNPAQQKDQRRVEIRLANESGKWNGAGLGDIYDYQFPVYKNIRIKQPGFYRFEVEQNMRDDILQHVKSTGIRVAFSES